MNSSSRRGATWRATTARSLGLRYLPYKLALRALPQGPPRAHGPGHRQRERLARHQEGVPRRPERAGRRRQVPPPVAPGAPPDDHGSSGSTERHMTDARRRWMTNTFLLPSFFVAC
jgi:hypothetical protein